MCEDKNSPVKLLAVKSVTELMSGKKCCSVNNGSPHRHCIKAENQRREKVHIRGNVITRSNNKQLMFSNIGNAEEAWGVDLLAYGQCISIQSASIMVGRVHSKQEDIVANLEYRYDDPFNPDRGYTRFSLTIPVTL